MTEAERLGDLRSRSEDWKGKFVSANIQDLALFSRTRLIPAAADNLRAAFAAYQQLSLQDPPSYVFDKNLGFHVERAAPFPLIQRFKKMLGKAG
jgi:hypothetical protein